MGSKRVGLARTQALIENLKRELNLSSTTLKSLNAVKAAEPATNGAGMVGTEVAPATYISKLANGDILTTIDIDLTGLKKASDVGDAIGLDGTDGAYFLQYVAATHGIVYRIELSCIEVPTGSNALKDIDVISQANADVAYDDDVSGGTALLTMGGNMALGQTFTNETVTQPTDGHYLVLADGATSSAAALFTAGKITIRLYGRASF